MWLLLAGVVLVLVGMKKQQEQQTATTTPTTAPTSTAPAGGLPAAVPTIYTGQGGPSLGTQTVSAVIQQLVTPTPPPALPDFAATLTAIWDIGDAGDWMRNMYEDGHYQNQRALALSAGDGDRKAAIAVTRSYFSYMSTFDYAPMRLLGQKKLADTNTLARQFGL